MKHIDAGALDRELKKGSVELLVLSLLEPGPSHGYDVGRRMETLSQGRIRLKAASLYPLLYRLEDRGWIEGRWVERPGERRRRFYRLTPAGRKALEEQRHLWRDFVEAMSWVMGGAHA
jgi:PadR family transcriptional regulator PadR